MVKLVPAKCPACGADLEVNSNLEKTICQYCGTTVLIDDAIQKIKVEHTGNIKIDGIYGESSKLDIVDKHLKLGKVQEAMNELFLILDSNCYNIEALEKIIEISIHEFQSKFKINLECNDFSETVFSKIYNYEEDSLFELSNFMERKDIDNKVYYNPIYLKKNDLLFWKYSCSNNTKIYRINLLNEYYDIINKFNDKNKNDEWLSKYSALFNNLNSFIDKYTEYRNKKLSQEIMMAELYNNRLGKNYFLGSGIIVGIKKMIRSNKFNTILQELRTNFNDFIGLRLERISDRYVYWSGSSVYFERAKRN